MPATVGDRALPEIVDDVQDALEGQSIEDLRANNWAAVNANLQISGVPDELRERILGSLRRGEVGVGLEGEDNPGDTGNDESGSETEVEATIDVFSVVDVDGETVLEVEPGDAIEVTFFNTIARRDDTVQGVIERIRPGAEGGDLVFTDGTRIVIGDESAFTRRRGEVVIDGRRRGHIREPVDQAIRKLFGNPDGRENKRRRWRLLQELTNEEVEEIGLGEGALPVRDAVDEDEREE